MTNRVRNQTSISSPERARELQRLGSNEKRGHGLRAQTANIRKRQMLTLQLVNELHNVDPEMEMTKARLLIKRLVGAAIKDPPDMIAVREIFDRVEGKARQQVDVTHDGDLTIRSAAISALDAIIEEAIRGRPTSISADVVPDGPVLPAQVLLPSE